MTRPGSSAPVDPTAPPADEGVMAREQAEILHGEIERLPAVFRRPVVLCYLEGLTVHEAARRLRWPHGTVRSRIARAREKLRRALTRRGIMLPGAALAAVLDSRPASASVSSPLCDITTRAAIHFAAGPAAGGALSASTAALAREVLRSMLVHKLKLVASTVLFLGVVATGAGFLSRTLPASAQSERRASPASRILKMAPTEPRPVGIAQGVQAKADDAAPGRMFVVGRVLDPAGKPMAGVPVDVIGRPRWALGAATQAGAGEPRLDRPGRDRRRRPIPLRCRAHRVDALLRGRCGGRSPRFRPRLGAAQPRRRSARGRDPPPGRAGHPRPRRRHQRPARRRRVEGPGRGRDPRQHVPTPSRSTASS